MLQISLGKSDGLTAFSATSFLRLFYQEKHYMFCNIYRNYLPGYCLLCSSPISFAMAIYVFFSSVLIFFHAFPSLKIKKKRKKLMMLNERLHLLQHYHLVA
jgi:hypothetical protein